MELKIFNSLTKTKEIFNPILPNKVHIYVCGMTVYDDAHLGHARAYSAFDIIHRTFNYLGYKVKYVRNITDIDDKIIKKAKEEIKNYFENPLKACLELSEKYTASFHNDMNGLSLLPPTIEPKATEHIPEIIDIIKNLLDTGKAYNNNGNVFFRVKSFNEYGKLSGRNIDEIETISRINDNDNKENPLDFALWKKHIEGEPYWESPFGKGRPGWHIECSAMSMKYLGETFDIHGGGQDLIFPHHENEICQSESYTGKQLANYWIHNGFITIHHEKMSKSLQNFKTVKELLNVFDANDLKFYLISTHYRSPIDFDDSLIKSAKESLKKISDTIARTKVFLKENAISLNKDFQNVVPKDFIEALCDDFNTPKALSVLFETEKELNICLANASDYEKIELDFCYLLAMLNLIGITLNDKQIFAVEKEKWIDQDEHIKELLINKPEKLSNEEIYRLIALRGYYKTIKNFSSADNIRNFLTTKNIEIRDQMDVCYWKEI